MEEKTLSFENLNLKKELLEGIYLHGFKKPSNIQIKGISSLNTGKDCILQSQSGTGKTATYLLGVMNRLELNDKILSTHNISLKTELLTLRNLFEKDEYLIPENLSSMDNSFIIEYLDNVGLEFILSKFVCMRTH